MSAIYLCVTLALIFLFLIKACVIPRRIRFSISFTSVVFLLIWILTVQGLYLFVLTEDVSWWTLGRYLSNTAVAPLLLVLIGKEYAEDPTGFSTAITLSWVFSTSLYIGSFFYIGPNFHTAIVDASIYLTLSDCYAIVSILFLLGRRQKIESLAIFAVSLWVLFFLNSRFSFIAFILTCFFIMACRNKLQAVVLACIAVLLLAALGPTIVSVLGPDHRMVRLFLFHHDSSMSERVVLLYQELNFLRENWVLGHYMYDVVATGGTGNYAHNYLSFLSAYGIGPAIVLIFLLLSFVLKGLIQGGRNNHFEAAYAMMIFSLLGIIAARSYLYPYIWFGLAAMASVYSRYPSRSERL
ncbi:O-antigen ligase [Pusillimonas sp. ANT_WB101]|uniref:O-antigen ligase family protein n=1 Tax=Pusillimonas sp. ANT_WB101 TaxID=2597356 RepID=UPI0011F01C7E|nr:O-antigen ligase family protein [Pusillimonas sp. ANT_WB101]KAA0889512.1 O-antigen ligase family protein [Pusillimonas sp. ANT_WB101]